MSDRGGLGHDRRSRAIFLHRQSDGALDLLGLKPSSLNHVMEVDTGEHFRDLLGPVGVKLDDDALDRLAALLEDIDHVIGGTAPETDQNELHCARSGRAAFWPVRRPKPNSVPSSRLADEGAVFNPFDACFHRATSIATRPKRRAQSVPGVLTM